MTDKEYKEYLESPAWACLRVQRLKLDNYTCQGCGKKQDKNTEPLQVHHITYRNIGHEDVYIDLVCLCSSCHKGVHRILNRVTDSEGHRGWKDNINVKGFLPESRK